MLDLASENWKYWQGDTFDFWTGPKPPKNHPKYAPIMKSLKEVYHSYNVIREAVTHYRDALVGRTFNWFLTAGGERAEETEAERMLGVWWGWQQSLTSQGVVRGKAIAEAVVQMLVRDGGDGVGCGYLRLYTPKRLGGMPEMYKRIVLHCPSPGSVVVERDDDGFIVKATYAYKNGKEEYRLLDDGSTEIRGYLNNQSETKISNFGGRLPIFELRGNCLIQSDARQCQNAINKTLTMKGENTNTAGFLERVLLNAQVPGKWENDPNSPGGERFVPDVQGLEFGPNKLVFVQGLPIGDPKSPNGYTSPSISYREPVSVATFKDSLEIDMTCFYRSMGLGHLLSSGDGSLSGVSRETLKGDFITRLTGYKENIEVVISDIFNTVLLLLGQTQYGATVQLNLATGNPLPEERDANRQDYNAGLRSRTTAMSASGINDPDAEWELIKREKEEDSRVLADGVENG